jgi:hypothetical protein
MGQLSRRSFLAGTAGLLTTSSAALASCGGATTAGSSGSGGTTGDYKLIQFFKSGDYATGSPQRLPFGLGDAKGVVQSGGPTTAIFRVFDIEGTKEVMPAATVTRHTKDLSRPYWPLIVNLPAGNYQARMEFGSKKLEPAAFSLVDPPSVGVLQVGTKLPAIATPTTADARGVTPICTRQPACPLHDTSLADALGAGKPIVFLVATPAYCQTAICGPVLDVLLKQRAGDVTMIHAEVYTDSTLKTPTPAIEQMGLDFEPCLFLAKADGTIVERLDVIFDSDEVSEALARLRKA